MSFLELSHIEKSFGAVRVVKDFNLSIEKGEFVSLLGPSGCGKTTVLRIVAGFETPSGGSVIIDGKDVTGQRANQRRIGMVFQSYALFPNLTVAQNVGFGLKVAGVPRAEVNERVAAMLSMIGLPEHGERFPFQLSGGQQQRVALARALAPRPKVLLLDEPLSALDAKIRVSLRNEIRRIQRDLGITTVFVTHDQEEALSMSDRVVVMNGGVAEQVGDPASVYNRPATRFVAGFVGTLNVFDARVEDSERGIVSIEGSRVTLAEPVEARNGEPIALALRPEGLRLGAAENRDVVLPALIDDVSFLGSVIRVRAKAGNAIVAVDMFNEPGLLIPTPGSKVDLSLSARDLIVLRG